MLMYRSIVSDTHDMEMDEGCASDLSIVFDSDDDMEIIPADEKSKVNTRILPETAESSHADEMERLTTKECTNVIIQAEVNAIQKTKPQISEIQVIQNTSFKRSLTLIDELREKDQIQIQKGPERTWNEGRTIEEETAIVAKETPQLDERTSDYKTVPPPLTYHQDKLTLSLRSAKFPEVLFNRDQTDTIMGNLLDEAMQTTEIIVERFGNMNGGILMTLGDEKSKKWIMDRLNDNPRVGTTQLLVGDRENLERKYVVNMEISLGTVHTTTILKKIGRRFPACQTGRWTILESTRTQSGKREILLQIPGDAMAILRAQRMLLILSGCLRIRFMYIST